MGKNGGRNALSGYILQTLYAIILCMKEDWEQIKVEPITPNDKTDILLLEDTECEGVDVNLSGNQGRYKSIQVKKRSRLVSQNELDQWCNSLLKDGGDTKCEVCLFGKLKDDVIPDPRVDIKVFSNNIDDAESMVLQEIAKYCELQNAKDYSESDLNDALDALFRKLMMNSINNEPLTKGEIEKSLKAILETSPDNRAAIIKWTSKRYFYQESQYLRDLKPARLDSTGKKIIMNQRLCADEFPKVQEVGNSPVVFSDYFAKYVKDNSVKRHIYLSATSGMGKSTCLYDLWEKYLDDNCKFVPLYIPLNDVKQSIKSYIVNRFLKKSGVKNFDWLDKGFNESSYHIVMLLDGYNELTGDNIEEIDGEIGDILNMEGVTVVISSRNPKMDLKKKFGLNITKLKVCPLTKKQISSFLGGNNEILIKEKYDGVLTNPFMLEICIKAYAKDVSNKLTAISQISMEKLLQDYIDKQQKDNNLSIENTIYLKVILPLAAMRLDKRKKNAEINKDPKFYKWEEYNKVIKSIQKSIGVYERSIAECVGDNPDGKDYIETIKTNHDLTSTLINVGIKLEVFSANSTNGSAIIWDHEIYRDYFVARGYALYALVHMDSENCIYNLARQVNYRYPEPKDGVIGVIRGYHVQKAQMFIDMVDVRLSEQKGFREDDFEKLKKTATYRRLIRDVAFIYEDLNDIKMGAATDLCLKYFSDDLKIYDRKSKHDYDSKMRRYADAAYSLSGLAYNYLHLKPVQDDKEKGTTYLKNAKDLLAKSDSLFKALDTETKEESTVKDDMVKYNGNYAAYNIAMYRNSRNIEYVKTALHAHEDNLKLRKEIKSDLKKQGKKGKDLIIINNNIAVSYSGVATCYYYLRDYDKAIKNHSEAIDIRTKINDEFGSDKKKYYIPQTFNSYRRIIGCLAEKENYSLDDAQQAIKWIIKTLSFANENDTLQDYEIMCKEIEDILNKLPEAVKQEKEEKIESLKLAISGKSLNS